jgi:hypothetical protein
LYILAKCQWGESGGGGQGGEMTQTMYAHVNKRIKKKKEISAYNVFECHFT